MNDGIMRLVLCGVVVALAGGSAGADTLTYSDVVVRNGAIDNQSLAGQTVTITIEFADGLVASSGKYSLGEISYAAYEFSGAGLFVVDSPQDNLEFGSLGGGQFALSFYDEEFNPLGMLSGCTAGLTWQRPTNGETMQNMFNRLGNGRVIEFTSAMDFQMLNNTIGTLNNGSSIITEDLVGRIGGTVRLTLNEATGYRLSVSGACPGMVTVLWRGADPDSQQALVFGANQQRSTIPNRFPCAGTLLDVAVRVQLVDPPGYFSTGSGEGSISGQARAAACGGYLQLVHAGSCQVSNVRRLP